MKGIVLVVVLLLCLTMTSLVAIPTFVGGRTGDAIVFCNWTDVTFVRSLRPVNGGVAMFKWFDEAGLIILTPATVSQNGRATVVFNCSSRRVPTMLEVYYNDMLVAIIKGDGAGFHTIDINVSPANDQDTIF